MNPEERQQLIHYRFEQADHALKQARLLADAGEWDGVVNRAYYAMFYASMALLLTKDMGASKHSGVLSLVDREFVKPGQVPKEMSMALRDALNQRQKTDYSELRPVSQARAEEILNNAARFIDQTKKIVPEILKKGAT